MPVIESLDEPQRIFTWSCNTIVGRRMIGGISFDRTAGSDLQVSGVHAALVWHRRAGTWQIVDLSSANHTFVDGDELEPGIPHAIRPGCKITFGGSKWQLREAEPPPASATVGSGRRVLATDGTLLLPDEDHPEWVIEEEGGIWSVRPWDEPIDASRPLEHGECLTTGSLNWRIDLPGRTGIATDQRTHVQAGHLSSHRLHLLVPPVMENIRPTLTRGDVVLALPSRRHHELWWLLARARLADRARGVPQTEEGWLAPDVLARQMGLVQGASYLNVLVHRSRKQLENAGFDDFASIIIRRTDPDPQLRIGLADLEIEKLGP